MTDIETWEPNNTTEALETLDQARQWLAQAAETDVVADMKDRAAAMQVYARQRNMAVETQLAAAEIVRRAERRLAELVIELREAGQVQGAGRPKRNPLPGNELINVRADGIFANTKEQRDATTFAQADDDTFNEALEAARAYGDLSRTAVLRNLRTLTQGGTIERQPRGETTDVPTAATMVPKAIRTLAAVVEALEHFDASAIEHGDRKQWADDLRQHCAAIDRWRKALPR